MVLRGGGGDNESQGGSQGFIVFVTGTHTLAIRAEDTRTAAFCQPGAEEPGAGSASSLSLGLPFSHHEKQKSRDPEPCREGRQIPHRQGEGNAVGKVNAKVRTR